MREGRAESRRSFEDGPRPRGPYIRPAGRGPRDEGIPRHPPRLTRSRAGSTLDEADVEGASVRLWSLHPGLLDPAGLVAVWREGLLAQAVLTGRTRGYVNHPQLVRFAQTANPPGYVAAYLRGVLDEAVCRGYRFDAGKLTADPVQDLMPVTDGQLSWEWQHLRGKLMRRAPKWLQGLGYVSMPLPHPLFQVVSGTMEPWERGRR